MDLLELVQENMYILIGVLYVIGMFLKKTPKVSDWLIPYILLIIAVILATALLQDVWQGVIQGVIITGVAVLANNFVKQTMERG